MKDSDYDRMISRAQDAIERKRELLQAASSNRMKMLADALQSGKVRLDFSTVDKGSAHAAIMAQSEDELSKIGAAGDAAFRKAIRGE